MTTPKRPAERSSSSGISENRRCSICGKTMTAPHKALTMDGKRLCDACYRDCFFADMESLRHLNLDRCAI
jgi:hypothetical protein